MALNVVRFWKAGSYMLTIAKPGFDHGMVQIQVDSEPTLVNEEVRLKKKP